MYPLLPDWMLAAIAIGGWELCRLGVTRLHLGWAQDVAYAIVLLCALILVIRYVARAVRRRRHPEAEDPDAWKRY